MNAEGATPRAHDHADASYWRAMLKHPFYFMRHGQTELNANGRICGRLDPPLDAVGRHQAQAAGAVLAPLPFSCVVVSSALRARETVALAVPGRAAVVVDDLRERDWGELEGRPLAELCRYTETPPGGEPWGAFLSRVGIALAHVLAQHDNPLIVAHSGVWRALRAVASGSPEGPRMANAQPVRVLPAATVMDPDEAQRRVTRNAQAAAKILESIPIFVL